jgi:lipopolysaccharide transport system ATP-binding protein
MSTAISVSGVSKQYFVSKAAPASTLREAVPMLAKTYAQRLKAALSGKAPFDRTKQFWALKDISFELEQGEVLGIIGRNGAGKSTLLKILSRITDPTNGCIVMRGRAASLLEVGTGFHQELTGRENIFLNGAILGMTQAEIRKRFDAIVAFAEVADFIDTPVKRYSSGMYMRLAFSVAAHIDTDILIVDEVLAVGDLDFQKKCLAKMDDISKSGSRTVLFVSHQMGAVSQLCTKAICLSRGVLVDIGDPATVVSNYIAQYSHKGESISFEPRSPKPTITELSVDSEALLAGSIVLDISFQSETEFAPRPGFILSSPEGFPILGSNSRFDGNGYEPATCRGGTVRMIIDKPPIVPGVYLVSAWLGDWHQDYDAHEHVMQITVHGPQPHPLCPPARRNGYLKWPGTWSLGKLHQARQLAKERETCSLVLAPGRPKQSSDLCHLRPDGPPVRDALAPSIAPA